MIEITISRTTDKNLYYLSYERKRFIELLRCDLYHEEVLGEFDSNTFKTQVEKLYKSMGYGSARAFASDNAISISTFNGWTTGRSQPKFSDIFHLATNVGVYCDYFLTPDATPDAFRRTGTIVEMRNRIRELLLELDELRRFRSRVEGAFNDLMPAHDYPAPNRD